MALTPRQPGSTIKPLVYLSAFEQPDRPPAERWTPGTLVADIKEEFPDGANPPYVPTDYDNKERGMVVVRTALANSLNIPAVRAMQAVGIPQFLATAQKLGVTTLTRPDYGLGLALGAGEIPLLEMTGAFAVFANQGVRKPPMAILKITDNSGNIICDAADPARPCSRNPAAAGNRSSARWTPFSSPISSATTRPVHRSLVPIRCFGSTDQPRPRPAPPTISRDVDHGLYAAAGHRGLGGQRRQLGDGADFRDHRCGPDLERVYAYRIGE